MKPSDLVSTHPLDSFASRHIGPDSGDLAHMLATIGVASADEIIAKTVPANILMNKPLSLDSPRSESEVLAALRNLAAANTVRTSLIGLGYYATNTPPVILRNVLENPAWYTSYTPYQPEISQGRLEALLNFQTLISELTGLGIANASLLDEPTAAAEAMGMAHRLSSNESNVFAVHADTHPQTIAVLQTRASAIGIRIELIALDELAAVDCFGLLVSRPATFGNIADDRIVRTVADAAHQRGALVVCATDLLASMLITPPGSLGCDIAVGSAQRFGVPMGYGGPHAGFLATSEALARALPGRLVGVSVDTVGRPAMRLALQTREQHIRRDKATSNICTAQALLANIAGFYAVWHGRDGLVRIARRIETLTSAAVTALRLANFDVLNDSWFDTVRVRVPNAETVHQDSRSHNILLRHIDASTVGFSLDETSTIETVVALLRSLGVNCTYKTVEQLCASNPKLGIPSESRRVDEFMTQVVFERYHSEHEMLRYMRRLADKDLSLDRTMIPLGSCTMKLNAAVEMIPITWPEFANIHPFAPIADARGYVQLIDELEAMLVEITGYDSVSFQPNAGSQGEFAGLLAIGAYHASRGDQQRKVCLIPSSAHGTNAASAVMAGMRVVVVNCDAQGNVDLDDLRSKCERASETLAALMITYPSTHGVFEQEVVAMCDLVHLHGGQVYIDGANLNAMVGISQPGKFGADVSHLNLHKTFCIPHGGGGPGVGPIGVKKHLAPFLPTHPLVDVLDGAASATHPVGPVAGAPYGSAGILPISWAYISLMGASGLRDATAQAIVNANYISKKLAPFFPTLYSGRGGFVAHECILDVRPITKTSGVTVDDIAKRLIDFGFHAPTVSFPVTGTLMVEPTESETLREIDRFCAAMISIAGEVDDITKGAIALGDSPLRNAPHTIEDVVADWNRTYSREQALYPLQSLRGRMYFPPVSRIDAAYGDRNLMCSCEPLSHFAS
ncbi:MAG: aminomethyl-transferring glycine dehydrogenase [Ilumatobacteraceae bacterium]